MVVGFTTTYVIINAYHHWSCDFKPHSSVRRGVLDTTLCDKVLSVTCYSDFFRVLQFPPQYSWNIVESDVKHHKANLTILKEDFVLSYLKRSLEIFLLKCNLPSVKNQWTSYHVLFDFFKSFVSLKLSS